MMEDEAASWLRIRRPLRLPTRMRRPMKSPRTWRSGERQQRRPSCPQWGRRHRRQLPTSGGRQPPKLRDSNRPAPSQAKDSPACQDHSSQTHCADGPLAEGENHLFLLQASSRGILLQSVFSHLILANLGYPIAIGRVPIAINLWWGWWGESGGSVVVAVIAVHHVGFNLVESCGMTSSCRGRSSRSCGRNRDHWVLHVHCNLCNI